MANKTINELSPVTLSSTSEFAVYQNGSTGKATLQNVTNAAINKLGIKNLLPYPYLETTETINGITFTDNGDGTITADGTATATTIFQIKGRSSGNTLGMIPGEQYIISGCPSGGSGSTYKLDILKYGQTPYIADYGSGASFTYSEETANDVVGQIRIVFYTGTTVSNLVFKPMIRLASDTDSTWQPYVATNATLTKQLNNDFLYADDEEEPTGEVEFTSSDELNPSSSTSVDLLTGNDSWGQRFAKISQMFKNVRYLLSKLGTTDISTVGNGTLTSAINSLNGNLTPVKVGDLKNFIVFNPDVVETTVSDHAQGEVWRMGKLIILTGPAFRIKANIPSSQTNGTILAYLPQGSILVPSSISRAICANVTPDGDNYPTFIRYGGINANTFTVNNTNYQGCIYVNNPYSLSTYKYIFFNDFVYFSANL